MKKNIWTVAILVVRMFGWKVACSKIFLNNLTAWDRMVRLNVLFTKQISGNLESSKTTGGKLEELRSPFGLNVENMHTYSFKWGIRFTYLKHILGYWLRSNRDCASHLEKINIIVHLFIYSLQLSLYFPKTYLMELMIVACNLLTLSCFAFLSNVFQWKYSLETLVSSVTLYCICTY